MDRVRELVTELMVKDEAAFIEKRVNNFFVALDEAGYKIVERNVVGFIGPWLSKVEPT